MSRNFWSNPNIASDLVKKHFPDEMQECIKLADDVCKNRFCFRGHWEMERTNKPVEFTDKIVWDKTPTNDPEWMYAFNRNTFLITLGQAWRFTQKQIYVDAAARLWEDWIDNVLLNEEAASTTWRPIETGLRCENWLRSLNLLSDVLEKSLLEKIDNCLIQHGKWLIESHKPFQKLSNWGILQDYGLLILGFYFKNNKWCDIAYERLNEELKHQVLSDGTHWEQSPLYHCEVIHCCLGAIYAGKKSHYKIPQTFLDKTYLMSIALGKMIRPDGKLFCQSDSDEVDARDILAEAAYLFNDPILKGYANGKFYIENCWNFGDYLTKYNEIPISTISNSKALEDSGNYMLWDGAGEDAGMLHFHCGSLGSGHGHADLLHIDLVYYGETILSDSGRYTYVENEIRKKLKKPSAHNTIVVDKCDFTKYKSSWSYNPIAEPIKGEYKFTHDIDFVSGSHLGYLSCGVFTRRKVLRLGSGLWVIWDDFHVSDKEVTHLYDRYFHFSPDGNMQVFGNYAIYHGINAKANIIFPNKNINLRTYRSPISREYNLLEESDCICAHSKEKGNCGFATVIAVDQKHSKISLTAELLSINLVSTGEKILTNQGQAVKINHGNDEWTIMFLDTEIISEVSLIESNGHIGYGKVQVFGPPCPDGICLSW